MTGSSLVSGVPDQRMDETDPIPSLHTSENSDVTVPPAEENDFGPWLLVSRRRGGTRGRGGGTRASRMTSDAAADPSPDIPLSRGAVIWNIRGGRSAASGGRPVTPHAPFVTLDADTQLPTPFTHTNASPPITFSSPNVPLNALGSQGIEVTPPNVLPPNPSTHTSPPLHLPPGEKTQLRPHRSKSSNHVLRSSITPASPSQPSVPTTSHGALVDIVSAALEDDGIEEDNSQDEDYSDDEDDDEMSTEESPDEGPDDSMTLIQYQTEARREALVRKGSNLSDRSPKKGRIESEELCS